MTDVKDLEQKAIQDDMISQYQLGFSYWDKQKPDYAESIKWFRKASDQGFAKAQYALGVMYQDGQGMPQDCKEALVWYLKAANQGNKNAQYALGRIYYYGQGVLQNYKQAFAWCSKAAEQESKNAQFVLGNLYYKGKGCKRDYSKAYKWYRKAAEQNNAIAQDMLWEMYLKARGVENSEEEGFKAFAWLKKAAESGYSRAQWNVGVAYRVGYCTQRDKILGYAWQAISLKSNAKNRCRICYYIAEKLLSKKDRLKIEEKVNELSIQINDRKQTSLDNDSDFSLRQQYESGAL